MSVESIPKYIEVITDKDGQTHVWVVNKTDPKLSVVFEIGKDATGRSLSPDALKAKVAHYKESGFADLRPSQ